MIVLLPLSSFGVARRQPEDQHRPASRSSQARAAETHRRRARNHAGEVVGENVGVDDSYAMLKSQGFAWIVGDFETLERAFGLARALIDKRSAEDGFASLSVIGDFVIPPRDGQKSRDFQTLHFDFGLPLDPKVEQDVARYTALHIPASIAHVSASTRLVPLTALLNQRTWPARPELVEGLISYGRTYGAWDDAGGYFEGSLARLVEAAAGASPVLPSVKLVSDFLCGLEFDSLAAELAFFGRHGLPLEELEICVALRPGELLIFDNLALAHGRRGARQPGELHQRVFGHKGLSPTAQLEVRDRVLNAFSTGQRAASLASMP